MSVGIRRKQRSGQWRFSDDVIAISATLPSPFDQAAPAAAALARAELTWRMAGQPHRIRIDRRVQLGAHRHGHQDELAADRQTA
jgi:hypothetical protein